MARKSEDELAAEIEAGSGGQRFPFKVRCSSSGGAGCRWLLHGHHRGGRLWPSSHQPSNAAGCSPWLLTTLPTAHWL